MKTVSERVNLRGVVNDLVISSAGDRNGCRSLAYLVPVALVVLILYRDLYSGTATPTGTAHPVQSIAVALNAHFCAKPQGLSARYSPQVFLTTRPDLMSRPFREVIRAEALTVADYCASVTEPVVVSENSLMWLTRLAFLVNSTLTPDGLGRFLGATRVFMLLVFGLALLRTGASLFFTLAALLVGCAILRAVGIRDTIYPFVLALPLLHAAIYGAARSSRFLKESRPGLATLAIGMGLLTAFSGSMRTILLPMCVAMFGVFLLTLLKDHRRRGARPAKALALAAAAFVAGYLVYGALCIYPLRLPDDPDVPNYTYHTFAHQLVLGLAVPESSFSRREGIEWNDQVGFALARRAMPDVTYLGPQYETALLRYYRGLWRKHPGEMALVYARKLRSMGDEVFLSAALVGTQFGIPRGPAEWLHRATNGLVSLAFGVAMFAVGLRRHLNGHGNRNLIVALVSLAALASLGEAFLMYSIFVGMYYSELLFFVFFAFLVLVQAAVDGIARMVLGLPHPHRWVRQQTVG